MRTKKRQALRPAPAETKNNFAKQAVGLFDQQLWCWGRDVLRPEGNWLIEIGFERIEAPTHRENCASVYSLELPQGRRVVLRGFGMFYGDDRLGGVFLPRAEFRPEYTDEPTLECPPWSFDDLPKLAAPKPSQQSDWISLTQDLIDWIHAYETEIADRLGVAYRQSTLVKWDNGKRPITPAAEIPEAWQTIAAAAPDNLKALLPRG